LQVDYLLLAGLGPEAPPRYRQLRGELATEMERLHLTEAVARQNLRAFLAERGIADDRAELILGPGDIREEVAR